MQWPQSVNDSVARLNRRLHKLFKGIIWAAQSGKLGILRESFAGLHWPSLETCFESGVTSTVSRYPYWATGISPGTKSRRSEFIRGRLHWGGKRNQLKTEQNVLKRGCRCCYSQRDNAKHATWSNLPLRYCQGEWILQSVLHPLRRTLSSSWADAPGVSRECVGSGRPIHRPPNISNFE